jgi:hypothetical protein
VTTIPLCCFASRCGRCPRRPSLWSASPNSDADPSSEGLAAGGRRFRRPGRAELSCPERRNRRGQDRSSTRNNLG